MGPLTPAPADRTRRSIVIAAAAAGIVGFLLYLNTAPNDFVFDDVNIAARNPLARDPAAVGAIFSSHYWAGVEEKGNLYRPLTIWSFAVNHSAGGPNAFGYHVTNAALHGAVSAIVAILASALGLGAGGAIAAGLLFATHPIHVEAVAPVVGRSELLAAFFGLAAWVYHLAATGAARPASAPISVRARGFLVAASSLLFAAALLSKENAAILPAIVIAADVALRGTSGPSRTRFASWGAMAGILALWLLARAAVVPGSPPGDPATSVFGGVDPLVRIMTAVGVLGRYLWLLIFPVRLSADYSFHQIPLITSPFDLVFAASSLAFAALAAAGLVLAFRGRLTGVALLVFLGALFPVSNLAFSIGAVMAERLLYLPSVGLCLLAPAVFTEAAHRWPRREGVRRAAAGALVAVCALYAVRVVTRNRDWRDAHTLFTATVRTSPNSAKAHYNLGVAQEDRGEIDASTASYRRAIEIKPDMAEARRNYGLALLRQDRTPEAIEHLAVAASLDPEIPDVFGDLGIAFHRVGRAREAEQAFRKEVDLRPESARAHYNLGSLLLEEGRAEEAIAPLGRAASMEPREADFQAQAGLALAALGRHEDAITAFERALQAAPSMSDLLVPLARSAAAAGRPDAARRAIGRARSAGIEIPADLANLP